MFTESKNLRGDFPGELYDLDLAPSGDWIGIIKDRDRQYLSFNGESVLVPKPLRFPKVAAIDKTHALVADSRGRDVENAWSISSSGEVKTNFQAGDAIHDLLANDRYFVFTYFDESAICDPDLYVEGNGVAIFHLSGDFAFGYQGLFRDNAVSVCDCYCACWANQDTVLFSPYMDFPLVSFDLENRTQEIWDLPKELAGSDALTTIDDRVYFHSPYNDERGIYEWKFGSKTANRVAEYGGVLRGLSKGRFLAVEKHGFTVIDFS